MCIHASDYECTVCCMRPGAKWSQNVPVRLRGKGVEYRGVCGLGAGWRIGGGGQLLAHWRAYLWILIKSPLCCSLSPLLTLWWIGSQSFNPLNFLKGTWTKEAKIIGNSWLRHHITYKKPGGEICTSWWMKKCTCQSVWLMLDSIIIISQNAMLCISPILSTDGIH